MHSEWLDQYKPKASSAITCIFPVLYRSERDDSGLLELSSIIYNCKYANECSHFSCNSDILNYDWPCYIYLSADPLSIIIILDSLQ